MGPWPPALTVWREGLRSRARPPWSGQKGDRRFGTKGAMWRGHAAGDDIAFSLPPDRALVRAARAGGLPPGGP